MATPTLYQRLLGADFERLPPVLRRFHSLPQGGQASGMVTVRGGAGWLRYGAARLLHLPRPGVDIPVRLQVVPRGDTELWIRQFGRQCIQTVQWQEVGWLVEQAGPLHFVFRVQADEMGLTFVFDHNRLHGIRLPAYAALSVAARATGDTDHWHLEVTVQAPLLGVIGTYAGEIHPLT